MRFEKVHIEGLGYVLPERVVTSEELEQRLAPVYERFGLRVGRLELMSGIRERRHFPPGTRPSEVAAQAGRQALEAAGIAAQQIGLVIHASVCRDFLEPATASVVHRRLELPASAAAFDLSNACLGFVNGMIEVANRLELGQIEAGLVVAGEDGGPLVEQTLTWLLANPELTKRELKLAFASLTIGSGAAAMVLTRSETSKTEHRLLGAASLADTSQVELCSGDHAGGGSGPLMETDAEALLHAGNALAARTWERFADELGWTQDSVERIVTHQIGSAHRRLLFETLELDPAKDSPTLETLGNIGSVSVPLTLARAVEQGRIEAGHSVALLGIGSGLHCQMLGLRW